MVCYVGRGRGRRGLSEPRVAAHEARTVCGTEPVTGSEGIVYCMPWPGVSAAAMLFSWDNGCCTSGGDQWCFALV